MKHFVLIDDNGMVHFAWKRSASKFGIDLSCYYTLSEFLSDAPQFDANTKIFLDVDLGNGLLGSKESVKLHEAGFKHIYLSTGTPSEYIKKPEYIKAVIGKIPPWEN